MKNSKKKLTEMARAVTLGLFGLFFASEAAYGAEQPSVAGTQRLLTLDSCRAMALRNNKQMGVAKVKQEVNANLRKSARTQYLPKVNAVGGYMWMSREISLLNDDQKEALSNLGTNATSKLQNALEPVTSQLPAATQAKMAGDMGQFAGALNQVGAGLVEGFRTDTRNMFAGAVTVTQPVFMGGALVAANKIADINEQMAANSLEMKRQNTLYNIDQMYWQVVSLRHKQTLAESYVELVKKLKGDVQKMIDQGVATKGDGLSVGVRVNEAEMALTQVQDGLALSKMLLCGRGDYTGGRGEHGTWYGGCDRATTCRTSRRGVRKQTGTEGTTKHRRPEPTDNERAEGGESADGAVDGRIHGVEPEYVQRLRKEVRWRMEYRCRSPSASVELG